jgi:Hypoxia induced protein conserved region
MSMMTFLIIAAMLGVVGSLAFGVAAMASHGEVGHRSSADWMTMRVAFQALALVLIVVTLMR